MKTETSKYTKTKTCSSAIAHKKGQDLFNNIQNNKVH